MSLTRWTQAGMAIPRAESGHRTLFVFLVLSDYISNLAKGSLTRTDIVGSYRESAHKLLCGRRKVFFSSGHKTKSAPGNTSFESVHLTESIFLL